MLWHVQIPALGRWGSSEVGPVQRPGRLSQGSISALLSLPTILGCSLVGKGALAGEAQLSDKAVSCPSLGLCVPQEEGFGLGALTQCCPWAYMNWDMRLGSGCGCP